MKWLLTLVVFGACCSDVSAVGPVRRFVANHRPGFVVPKPTVGVPAAPAIPPCGCGCMQTGQCLCKNCAERTADPAWKAGSYPSVGGCVGGRCALPKK
jgi:hypothetical protein